MDTEDQSKAADDIPATSGLNDNEPGTPEGDGEDPDDGGGPKSPDSDVEGPGTPEGDGEVEEDEPDTENTGLSSPVDEGMSPKQEEPKSPGTPRSPPIGQEMDNDDDCEGKEENPTAVDREGEIKQNPDIREEQDEPAKSTTEECIELERGIENKAEEDSKHLKEVRSICTLSLYTFDTIVRPEPMRTLLFVVRINPMTTFILFVLSM